MGKAATIPQKLNVFYNQAYEAIFQRHDALKPGFKRDRRTNLDVQDFARVFAAFCIHSYDIRKLEFTETDAINLIVKARDLSGLDFDVTDFLRDSLQSVCLLVADGLNFVFAHRSFQEYFAARFIAGAAPGRKQALIERYTKRSHFVSDNVINLLYEMDPIPVEDYFVLPAVERMHVELRRGASCLPAVT